MRGRRALILVEVVDRYIRTKKPVSSAEIVREYGHRLSPATVRAELLALEREGFLSKPHVAAGRVPTLQGFRFFADWLLALAEMEPKEEGLLAEPLPAPALPPLPTLLRHTALLLAAFTGELGFVIPPAPEDLRCVGLVIRELSQETALVVSVSELGLMEARLVKIPKDITTQELAEAEALLSSRLRGRPVSESLHGDWTTPSGWHTRSSMLAQELFLELARSEATPNTYVEGWPHLLGHLASPDLRLSPDQLADLLHLLEDGLGFSQLLAEFHRDRPGVAVHVGDDRAPGLQRFALVTSHYFSQRGFLGVVGPWWMDYARAISAVRYLAGRLRGILAQPGGER